MNQHMFVQPSDEISGLTQRRKLLGLSRERLASAAGVTGQTVLRIETRQVTPHLSTVTALNDALKKFEARAGNADPEKTSGAGGGQHEE